MSERQYEQLDHGLKVWEALKALREVALGILVISPGVLAYLKRLPTSSVQANILISLGAVALMLVIVLALRSFLAKRRRADSPPAGTPRDALADHLIEEKKSLQAENASLTRGLDAARSELATSRAQLEQLESQREQLEAGLVKELDRSKMLYNQLSLARDCIRNADNELADPPEVGLLFRWVDAGGEEDLLNGPKALRRRVDTARAALKVFLDAESGALKAVWGNLKRTNSLLGTAKSLFLWNRGGFGTTLATGSDKKAHENPSRPDEHKDSHEQPK
jgi:hypothetical protein